MSYWTTRSGKVRQGKAEAIGADVWSSRSAQLGWLAFLLVPLRLHQPSQWLATGSAITAFMVVYFYGYNKRGPALWLSRAGIFTIGMALFPYNYFAHTLFIYASVPALRARTSESIALIVVTLLAAYAYFTWQHTPGPYFGLVTVLVLAPSISILVARAQRRAQLLLADKDVEIARLAKLAERERIARDLHDLLGHTLSLIAIKADLAGKLAGDSEAAAREMSEIASVSRQALAEVRQTIIGMRRIGLAEAARAAHGMLEAANIQTRMQVEALPALEAVQEHALAQALMEAATNIARHASASQASISVFREDSRVTVQIDDNGQGGTVTPGNGLRGMRERLESLHGSMHLARLEPGLRLTASVPMERKAEIAT